MRKTIVFLYCLGMLLLYGCSMKKYEGGQEEMDCVASRRMAFNNSSEDEIRIILNKDCMDDPVKTAQEIVDRYSENDFKSIHFCSTPNKISVEAYLYKDDKNPVLKFEYDVDNQKYNHLISNK